MCGICNYVWQGLRVTIFLDFGMVRGQVYWAVGSSLHEKQRPKSLECGRMARHGMTGVQYIEF